MYQILLIDDDPTILQGLKTIVADYFSDKIQTKIAADGCAALCLLQKEHFDIIVSDNKMPKLDGLTLLRILKENNISSYVIIVSGFDDYTYIRTAMKLGIYDYLLKPINVKEFVNILNELLPSLQRKSDILPSDIMPVEESFLDTDRSFFDLPCPEPYTYEVLSAGLSILQNALFSMNEEAVNSELNDIFYHISPSVFTKDQVQEMLSNFVYSAMENNSQMIRIVSKYKLTKYDIISKIKNLPNLSQLHETMKEILLLYISELTDVKKMNEEYIVKKAKKYIENHYHQEITLASLASLFRLHPNYFSSLFKAHTNITVRDYICQVRIQNAMQLLQQPDSRILDVALSVGYQDAAHFTRAFKRQTSMTPSLYKQTVLRKEG